MVQARWGSVSITGDYRDNNEDKLVIDPDGRYFIVADGMGGQSAGEKASEIASEIVPRQLEELVDFQSGTEKETVAGIDAAVRLANQEVMSLSRRDIQYHNMGTTIAFIVSAGGKFYVGGIGDSRVYRLRNGNLDRLTTDHSLTQALLQAGTITEEEAATHRYRNVLYRYLGTREGGTGTGAEAIEPQSEDRFLICSDGITDGLSEEAIAQHLGEQDEPQPTAESLVDMAEQGGSKDNITCIVVFVDSVS